MADILTQIQDELDMLLNQMQSSLAYIKHKAPPAEIPGQPLLSSFVEHEAQAASQSQPTQPTASNPSQPTQATSAESAPSLPSKSEFDDALRELARDLVLKEQQIEVLIASLPGLNTSETEQIEQMKQLEKQLEQVEEERFKAVKDKELLIKEVEEKILGVGKAR